MGETYLRLTTTLEGRKRTESRKFTNHHREYRGYQEAALATGFIETDRYRGITWNGLRIYNDRGTGTTSA
jgi:hypothetical protein